VDRSIGTIINAKTINNIVRSNTVHVAIFPDLLIDRLLQSAHIPEIIETMAPIKIVTLRKAFAMGRSTAVDINLGSGG
jgi:hypothetical protein